jgi:PIN domain nuclease of toxin-antitoxin system
MLLLLDTCSFLWLADKPAMLSQAAKEAISNNPESLFISSVSAFELSLKHRRGKLLLPLPPEVWIGEAMKHHGVREVPVDWRMCVHAAGLPNLHNDPFDRIIIATAQRGGLTIVTPDGLIRAYPGTSTCW